MYPRTKPRSGEGWIESICNGDRRFENEKTVFSSKEKKKKEKGE